MAVRLCTNRTILTKLIDKSTKNRGRLKSNRGKSSNCLNKLMKTSLNGLKKKGTFTINQPIQTHLRKSLNKFQQTGKQATSLTTKETSRLRGQFTKS